MAGKASYDVTVHPKFTRSGNASGYFVRQGSTCRIADSGKKASSTMVSLVRALFDAGRASVTVAVYDNEDHLEWAKRYHADGRVTDIRSRRAASAPAQQAPAQQSKSKGKAKAKPQSRAASEASTALPLVAKGKGKGKGKGKAASERSSTGSKRGKSAYNKFVARFIKGGRGSMADAAAAWRAGSR